MQESHQSHLHLRVFDCSIRVAADAPALLARIRRAWEPLLEASSPGLWDMEISLSRYPRQTPAVARLQHYSNERFLFWLDKKRCITCDLSAVPWKIHLQYFDAPEQDKDFDNLGLFLFPVLLRNLLKRRRYFQMHCAVVESQGAGILMPARSGSGKTTTSLTLLREGFNFICDDQVFMRDEGTRIEALGLHRDIFLLEDSLARFPEFSFLSAQAAVRKGHRYKKALPVSRLRESFPGSVRASTHIRFIVFPSIDRSSKTGLRPVEAHHALQLLLQAETDDYRVILRDGVAMKRQLDFLGRLVEGSPCFLLNLGQDSEQSLVPVLKQMMARHAG